jgi:putative transport protein
MDTLLQYLAERPLILLFLIIGIGFLLSHIKIKGVGLGVAFVLFTGIAFGAWGKGYFNTPELVGRMELISQIGLMIFVYCIFQDSLAKRRLYCYFGSGGSYPWCSNGLV